MSWLQIATTIAAGRPFIEPRGNTSMPRMVAILENGKDYYEGWNSYKTHPLQARFKDNPEKDCIHAETAAIGDAIRDHTSKLGIKRNDLSSFSLKGFTLHVARVDKGGRPVLAKPCSACQKMIDSFGISQVNYTR